jgi:hypothetical protein
MASEYLERYKFRNWTHHSSDNRPVTASEKQDKALKIASRLCSHTEWKVHGHGLSREVLNRELGIRIDAPGALGARWAAPIAEGGFEPYIRGGAGVGLITFGDDEVNGLALLGQIGGGGKFRVAERVSVGAEASLFIGPGFFSDDLGTLGYGGLVVQGGVELDL